MSSVHDLATRLWAAIGAQTRLIDAARRFDGLKLPPDLARKFLLLKIGLTLPAPMNAA